MIGNRIAYPKLPLAVAAAIWLGLVGVSTAQPICKPSGLCMYVVKQDARHVEVEFHTSGATHFNYKRPGGVQHEQKKYQYTQLWRLGQGEERVEVQWCKKPVIGKSECGRWETFVLPAAAGTASQPQKEVKVLGLGKKKIEPSGKKVEPSVQDIVANVPAGNVLAVANRCKQGFVWREARQGDVVCVTPEARTQAASENRRLAERRDPGGAYGPNSCVQGYVWREAFDGDIVCVTPERRQMVRQENSVAASRRVGG